jgi:nucleoside recognition membrane protein YjiH
MFKQRKLLVVVLFGLLVFTAFIFTKRDVSCYTALVGSLIGLAGWFNQANVAEHKSSKEEK